MIRHLSSLRGCMMYTESLIQKANWDVCCLEHTSWSCSTCYGKGTQPASAPAHCSPQVQQGNSRLGVCYTEVMFIPAQMRNDFLCISSFTLFGNSPSMSRVWWQAFVSAAYRTQPSCKATKKGSFCEAFREKVWRNMPLLGVQWLLSWAVVGSFQHVNSLRLGTHLV